MKRFEELAGSVDTPSQERRPIAEFIPNVKEEVGNPGSTPMTNHCGCMSDEFDGNGWRIK